MLCPLGVQVWARERDWIAAQHMKAHLALASGSCSPPLFLHCHYTPSSSQSSGSPNPQGIGSTPVVLLGATGITFDRLVFILILMNEWIELIVNGMVLDSIPIWKIIEIKSFFLMRSRLFDI